MVQDRVSINYILQRVKVENELYSVSAPFSMQKEKLHRDWLLLTLKPFGSGISVYYTDKLPRQIPPPKHTAGMYQKASARNNLEVLTRVKLTSHHTSNSKYSINVLQRQEILQAHAGVLFLCSTNSRSKAKNRTRNIFATNNCLYG